MKLLLLTSSLPLPADQGSKIRNYQFLQRLAGTAEVYLVSIGREKADDRAREELQTLCCEVHCFSNRRGVLRKVIDVSRSFLSGVPYLVLANSHSAIKQRIRELVEREGIDAIQVAELCMAGNVGLPPGKNQPPVILDAHNAEGPVQRAIAALMQNPLKRMFFAAQARQTERYEAEVAGSSDAVFCVSPGDLRYFTPLTRKPVLVPNAVSQAAPSSATRDHSILFTGTLRYPPNLDGLEWFLENIWPLVSARLPDARFDVVARDVPARLLKHRGERVRFLTGVDTIEPYLQSARVMAVPLRAGGGTRFKILQAFANGLPVVSTAIGADGLGAVDGEHALLRDDANGFAEAIVSLYDNPSLRNGLAGAGLRLVESQYRWETIFRTCESTYRELTS